MTASSIQPIDAFLSGQSATFPEAAPDSVESRLIRCAREGSTPAFHSLVELHQEMIHRLCRQWLRCEEDAREACQDTFLKAWQALPAWEPRGKLRTWLYQIALNVCRDRAGTRAHRQQRLTVSLLGLNSDPACHKHPPDVAAAHSSDMEKLHRGLALLPGSLRAVLILCGIEGISHQEAAAVLGCSSRAVEGRLYRARRTLLKWWNTNS